MLWITTTPGSAVQSNGSTVCMIGGSGRVRAKIARTKSSPDIDAITSVGVTPYSIFGAMSSMAWLPAAAVTMISHHMKSCAVAPAL